MLTLFASPGPCSLISIVALEKARARYHLNNVDVEKNEHLSAEYLDINPKGRVPSLVTPDGVITEPLGIIFYIHKRFPAAQILPRALNFIESTCHLAWLTSHIHPLTRQYCGYDSSDRFVDSRVLKECAEEQLNTAFEIIQKRLGSATFWCNENWSLLDVYLYCIVGQLKEAGFDFSMLKRLTEHHSRLARIPIVYRAQSKESLL